MRLSIKDIFFPHTNIKTFFVTRLHEGDIAEKVFLQKDEVYLDISKRQSMICLDPFCIAVWLPVDKLQLFDPETVSIQFTKGPKTTASLKVSLITELPTDNGTLLLYKLEQIRNYQLNPLHRLILLGYLLRSKVNTYQSRRTISALYSYPRKIIIVSYQDEEYYNIFPMDIQGYIPDEGIYLLGLRTTNATLNKIIAAKKVVICDTDNVDLDTVYTLGKHSSHSPTKKEELPFGTIESDRFKFPVPTFSGEYKELQITDHKVMGFHMLLVGKVVNHKVIRTNATSLYHVGFLQFQKSGYNKIEGTY